MKKKHCILKFDSTGLLNLYQDFSNHWKKLGDDRLISIWNNEHEFDSGFTEPPFTLELNDTGHLQIHDYEGIPTWINN
jgi:hypothetical protein